MNKPVTLGQLKNILNRLTPDQLKQPAFVNREDMGVSGLVTKISKTRSDLLYDGEDDPSSLKTKAQLRDEGYEKSEIDAMDVEIPKGSLVFNF